MLFSLLHIIMAAATSLNDVNDSSQGSSIVITVSILVIMLMHDFHRL
jgi:hypothetical protein